MSVSVDSVDFIVTKVVVIDEDKIWDAHAGDMLFSEDEVISEAKSQACSKAIDALAPAINGYLGSAFGYEWSKFTPDRHGENLYKVRATVKCYADGFDDTNEFIAYANKAFSRRLGNDESISFGPVASVVQ